MLGTSLLFRYNKLVWRPMVSDTVYVPIQGLLTTPLLTMRQCEHLLERSARDLVIDYIVTYPAIYDNGCDHLVVRLPGCMYNDTA